MAQACGVASPAAAKVSAPADTVRFLKHRKRANRRQTHRRQRCHHPHLRQQRQPDHRRKQLPLCLRRLEQGRLVKNSSNVVIVTYGCDALHRHVTDTVGSTVTDRFFSYDWQLLETKVGSNTLTRNVWSPVYVDGLVLRDRDTDSNGTLDERLYSLQDANWNTTALVNAGGTVQERYTYTPFGQVTFRYGSGSTLSASAKDWVFLHQGGERIAAGDYEFRNRVYSPSPGRWLSNDPLGFNAGDQNWYRAVGNNPGNGGDPDGLIATFKEPVLSPIGPDGMSIDPDQPYFVPSGDWFGDFSNYSAGLGDTVSIGITKRIRTWVGYDDVVNYDSGAYAGGQYTGTAVNVGLGVVNPCALGSAVAIPVRLINAGQAIGGTINAGENIANGNYWEAGFDLVGVAGNAGQVLRPCFAAGTSIKTKTGTILIENLQVGDRVLSRNEFDPNGQVDEKIVEDVFVRSAPILNVVVQGRVIRTTSEHPFWVDGKGWTAAGELKAGDNLLTAGSSKLPVEYVSKNRDTETVYNFQVAEWHTYFVGKEDWDFEVWVHNTCGPGAKGVQANKAAGDAWEAELIKNHLPKTQTNIQPQITIKSSGPSGKKVRVDAVGTDASTGGIKITDGKASPKAPLTPNQKIVYPELKVYGGTVVGKGKPHFLGGTPIPPTEVDIIRMP